MFLFTEQCTKSQQNKNTLHCFSIFTTLSNMYPVFKYSSTFVKYAPFLILLFKLFLLNF